MSTAESSDRLVSIVSDFVNRRVLVLGDAILDEYLSGDCSRISPEAPVPVVRVHNVRRILGGAANTAANVEPALGAAMRHFDPRCLFYFDRSPEAKSKAWCLSEGARVLGLAAGQCVFVGDQPADAAAARAAGVEFLGVSYGWGLPSGSSGIHMVDSVDAIAEALTTDG